MKAIIFDADGTLVDSVYFFVEAYHQAYQESGLEIARSKIHTVVGMGCDKAGPYLTSPEWFVRNGATVGHRAVELYKQCYLPKVTLFTDAEKLCRELKTRGFTLALASSSSADIVSAYLQLFSETNIFDFVNTSSEDIRTKPDPDIFLDIITRGQFMKNNTIVIGDSIWDVQAAKAAGVKCIGVRTGGFHPDDLQKDGACEIYDDVRHLLGMLNQSIISRLQ